MEEEQLICQNCKREVPACNMVIHMVRCVRSITCKICNDVIPGDKHDEHMATHKRLEKCKHCQKEIRQKDLENHILTCDERMISCEYCELDLRKSDMDEHMAYCGTRTERCDGCNQLIMFKDKKLHLDSNHTFIKTGDDQEQCPDCKKNIAKEDVANHLLTCDHQLLNCEFCEKEVRKSHLDVHEKYCGTRTERCPVCDELVMFKYKTLHLESNHTFLKLNDEPGPLPLWQQPTSTRVRKEKVTELEPIPLWAQAKPVSTQKQDPFDFENFDDLYTSKYTPKEVAREMNQISNLFNSDFPQYKEKKKTSELQSFLNNPLEKFLTNTDNTARPKYQYDSTSPDVNKGTEHGARSKTHRIKRKAPQPPRVLTNTATNTPPSYKATPKVNDEVLLPCEICEKLFNPVVLMDHQENCPRRYLTRVYGKEDDNLLAKLTQNIPPIMKPEESDDIKLPCEFCYELFPESRLLQHQQACDSL